MRGRPTVNMPPVVVVWKASKHGRSKPKMKVFKTNHVDEIIEGKVAGIPKNAIYLDTLLDKNFHENISIIRKNHIIFGT